MLVDVIFPGWVPFSNLALSADVPGFIKAHEQVLAHDFNTFRRRPRDSARDARRRARSARVHD
jgi:hypothetical protein